MSQAAIRARLRELAAALPALREAEAAAREKATEARLAVDDIQAEEWGAGMAGRLDAAVQEWRRAEQDHQQAARAVEANLREGGGLRGLLLARERAS